MASSKESRSWQLWAFALIVPVFTAGWLNHPPYAMADFATYEFSASDESRQLDDVPLFEQQFASSDLDEFVHSPSVTALPDGDLLTVWFAGSREGAADVDIRAARYDALSGQWGAETALVDRETTRRSVGKPIRKLGNPVIALAPDERLWLFYVSVSVGGWAGSAINVMVSEDLGESWSKPRQLVTSPFVNISTLVRTSPVFHADGSIGLPVYHEFLGKFPEYLYLDAQGRIKDKFRIADGDNSLQPTIVPIDGKRAVALLRQAGENPHVLATITEDAGKTWLPEWPVTPWNPNASLAAVKSHRGSLLVAQNNLVDGRFRLTLDEADVDLVAWSMVAEVDASPDPEGDAIPRHLYEPMLETNFLSSSGSARRKLVDEYLKKLDRRMCKNNLCDFQYEYPSLIRAGDGRYHLVYVWNNSFIKHVAFNSAWVEAQL
ncbi:MULTISPECIES: exo-alpha-sialidase [Pseudomonas]|uniref:sialidase family protein n=1 Tax=Pseudomonas TaxID=286 RepID=UPI00123A7FA3|nr:MULTISPECIES: sialidase family protein [Pseudomonas]QIB52895.1 exo-alpha-sialidase [Pseudomonas sp. OIL-1]